MSEEMMDKTDAEIEREKRIWLEANGMVEDLMRRINSGICRAVYAAKILEANCDL
jgi:hypothetical protein